MPASPFFLSRESLGDSVLPTATLYPPMASDFPFVSLHHSYSFLAFLPTLYVYWVRLGFHMFLSLQEWSPSVVRGLMWPWLGDWSRWFLLLLVFGIKVLFMPYLTVHASSCTLTMNI